MVLPCQVGFQETGYARAEDSLDHPQHTIFALPLDNPEVGLVAMHHPERSRKHDMKVIQKMVAMPMTIQNKARQQGIYESIHHDLLVDFRNCEFGSMNITHLFPQDKGFANIQQGYDHTKTGEEHSAL
ncbi:hypothetical protein U9M48_034894 [Paspalum notatum var. saurae]|uniref:Uncharacterized protein n=1 Tax=Paspalum notatum var. saurae TaxID=547442 RepID=A0AAQ3U9X4_PASNO